MFACVIAREYCSNSGLTSILIGQERRRMLYKLADLVEQNAYKDEQHRAWSSFKQLMYCKQQAACKDGLPCRFLWEGLVAYGPYFARS